MIAEALDSLRVPLESLSPHPENPRRGDVAAIKESLEEFGQVRPIVTNPQGVILAGHHVYYAAKDLGWDEIAAVQPDLTEQQQKRYLLADNRLADLGSYDQDILSATLAELRDAGALAGTGWQPDDVDELLAEIEGPEIEPEPDEAMPPEQQWDENAEPPEPMREVVLMLRGDEFETFAQNLRKLKAAYELDATTATVREAVKREHERQAAA